MKVTKEINPFEFCAMFEDCDCGCPFFDNEQFAIGECPVGYANAKGKDYGLTIEIIMKDGDG